MSKMRLALFQPEIPQNVGAIIRTASCFGFGIDIIYPIGFILSNPKFKRSSMDYKEGVDIKTFHDWDDYLTRNLDKRIIAIDVSGTEVYWSFRFLKNDIILLGKESSGLPLDILNNMRCSVKIPMASGKRSLNASTASAIVMSEMRRQLL